MLCFHRRGGQTETFLQVGHGTRDGTDGHTEVHIEVVPT